MKILFISNYLNNHQTELCNALYAEKGVDFCFMQTENMSEERLKLGWEIDESLYPYLKRYQDFNEKDLSKFLYEQDVIIYGDSAFDLFKRKLNKDVLVLYYRERLFKKGKVSLLRKIKHAYNYRIKNRKVKKAVLCASAYASYDFSLLGAFKNARYKWGYFPKVYEYLESKLKRDKTSKTLNLLWVGRFIDWKRTSDVIDLAKKLKDNDIKFNLKIIGTGELENEIKNKIEVFKLNDVCSLVGSLPQEKTREEMLKADALIVTSDKNEGWGVVVNEGMNAGAVVISSNEVGSAPYLINDSENGYLYNVSNIDEIFSIVEKLYEDRELINIIGSQAYKTIVNNFTPELAVKRLLTLIDSLKSGKPTPFESGVCSIAQVIKGD